MRIATSCASRPRLASSFLASLAALVLAAGCSSAPTDGTEPESTGASSAALLLPPPHLPPPLCTTGQAAACAAQCTNGLSTCSGGECTCTVVPHGGGSGGGGGGEGCTGSCDCLNGDPGIKIEVPAPGKLGGICGCLCG